MPQQFALCQNVPVSAIAPDADADCAGRAALALRLPYRVQNALPHAFQRAIGTAEVLQRAGQGILSILVLTSAAL